MSKKKRGLSGKQIIDVEGIIIPVRWDKDGNPIKIALATSKEKEFPINMKNEKGKKLLEFLQRKVKIAGSIAILANNQEVLTIRKFQLIDYDHFNPNNSNIKISI